MPDPNTSGPTADGSGPQTRGVSGEMPTRNESRHVDRDASRSKPGDRVGPYTLLELIGEGGFGTVWLAERREPMVQRVAIKIIKPGMDSKAVVARFDQERQALAVMDHPNVAKVFDGGVTERGLPYFVMEHVAGEPITNFCDRHRYTIRQRLETFISVCDAVQHAHMKGIIHRDIKPSNVLAEMVDGKPLVKVIDFGIAKALVRAEEMTQFTSDGMVIGTPEYMSPEQAGGQLDVDTRTDVYALGIVLYELLVGRLPFDPAELHGRGFDEIRRIIREEDPPKPSTRLSTVGAEGSSIALSRRHHSPSTLIRELRRELEWIPLKAMRKDRDRRYESAAAFGEDVRRYLDGRALRAAPESRVYLARKFVDRNRTTVFGAVLVCCALATGLAGTLTGFLNAAESARSERAARLDAQANEREARAALSAAETARASERRARYRIEHDAYLSAIQGASAWRDALNFARAAHDLESAPKTFRGWDWAWLRAEADTSSAVMLGHTASVLACATTADDARIVTAAADGTFRVWDAASGAALFTIPTDVTEEAVWRINSDARVGVVGTRDGGIQVWDLDSRCLRHVIASKNAVGVVRDLDPNGRYLVTAQGKSLSVLNLEDGRVISTLRGSEQWVSKCAFDHSGVRVLAVAGATLRVFEAVSGRCLATMSGHGLDITDARFSPDGTLVASISRDGTLRLWDSASGAPRLLLRDGSAGLSACGFSPDSQRVFSVSNEGGLKVWNVVDGRQIGEWSSYYRAPATGAFFCPEGRRVFVTMSRGMNYVWSLKVDEGVHALRGAVAAVTSAASFHDGTQIVLGASDGSIRVWDWAGGGPVTSFGRSTGGEFLGDALEFTTFSPDGFSIAIGYQSGKVKIFETANLGLRSELKAGSATQGCFSPDSQRVAIGSKDGDVTVWDVTTGRRLAIATGNGTPIIKTAFLESGGDLVVVSQDGSVRHFDPNSGATNRVIQWPRRSAKLAAMTRDGTHLGILYRDGFIRVGSTHSAEPTVDIDVRGLKIYSISFVRDGAGILGACDDRTARLWDTSSGEQTLSLSGHRSDVVAAVELNRGLRLLTSDGNPRIWDAESGAELTRIANRVQAAPDQPDQQVVSAEFSPAGDLLLTTGFMSGSATLWDAVPKRIRRAARSAGLDSRAEALLVARYFSEIRGELPASWLSDPRVRELCPLSVK